MVVCVCLFVLLFDCCYCNIFAVLPGAYLLNSNLIISKGRTLADVHFTGRVEQWTRERKRYRPTETEIDSVSIVIANKFLAFLFVCLLLLFWLIFVFCFEL